MSLSIRFFLNLPKVVRLLISLILVIILASFINLSSFIDSLRGANVRFLLLAIPLFFVGVLFSTLRWHSILEYLGIKASKREAFGLYLEGAFLSNFLPASIGGDVYKYLNLAERLPNEKKKVFLSLLLERGSGFVMFTIINTALLIPFYKLVLSNRSLIIIEGIILIGSALGVLLFLLILFVKKTQESWKNTPIVKYFYKYLFVTQYLSRKWILPAATYSLLFTLCILAVRILCLLAFSLSPNIFLILLFTTVIQIAGVLPISLNSIGVTEGLMTFLYTLIGVPLEVAFAVAIIERVLMTLASISGAFVLHHHQSDQNISDINF